LLISHPNITAVLLAAGRGTRFGGNKLEAMLGDAMLGLHAARTLAAMDFGALFAVHDPAHTKLATALRAEGFTLIDNDAPDAGLSHSLALATAAALATDADAMLICLADMPFVTTDHLRTLIGVGGNRVVASATGDARMPPALFPRAFWPTLATLSGDAGARTILRGAITVQAAPDMLADIDTRADLNRSS
jgi:molybdenum cofactor cytidylyltransferase